MSNRIPYHIPILPSACIRTLTVRQIRRINRHPVETDENSARECISDTEDGLNWNVDLDNPIDSEGNCMEDVEWDIEQRTSSEDPEFPEQRDVSAAPNVHGLIRPTWKSK